MEEIKQAPEEEWNRKLCITFIEEEGLDAGGLTREFLTLLYDHSLVFENSVLSFDAQLLEKTLLINGTNGHNGNFKWPSRTKESHETCCGLHS